MAKETPTKKKNKKTARAKAKAVKPSVQTTAVPAAPARASAPVPDTKPRAPLTPVSKLARWYKWLGLTLFFEGLAVVLLSRSVTAPLTVPFPAIDTLASESNGRQIVALASRHLADVHIEWVVATFLIVFGAVSLMMATLYRPQLDASINRGINAFRWLALGLGGGLMVVTIGLIGGISSLPLLVALFGATVVGALLGLAAELVVVKNDGAKDRFARVLCKLAVASALLPWTVFGAGVVGAMLWNGHIPGFLYSMYACQFVLFIAILLATHFRLKRQGKWADAAYTDRGYLLLTFVAATVLAVQVFAGVLK